MATAGSVVVSVENAVGFVVGDAKAGRVPVLYRYRDPREGSAVLKIEIHEYSCWPLLKLRPIHGDV